MHAVDEPVRDPGMEAELNTLRRRMRELEAHTDERVRIEDALRGVATSAGAGTFDALVRALAHALRADFVSVSELVAPGRLRTLRMFADGSLAENFEYDVRGTPCEKVVGRDFYVCANNVRETFPDDAWLVENGVESYVGTPLYGRDGKPLGNIAISSRKRAQDVPLAQSLLRSCALRASGEIERMITERELLRAEEELHQAQRIETIGMLAGGVAHDFNNLLCVILGRAELLSRELQRVQPELAPEVTVIHEAGERAAALTKQLLAFGRKQTAHPGVLDLNALLASMNDIVRRLVGESIELRTFAAADLGRIFADRSRIEQVVLNLVVNARDAMPRGGKLTLVTSNVHFDETGVAGRPDARPGRYVMLAVTDTGIGMGRETLARVFEPFFTTKPEGRGTGLGLATVINIVKHAEGFVDAYSAPGRGTSFKVYLPVIDAEPTLDQEALPRAPAVGGTEMILIVEDDDLVRALTRTVLDALGYQVLVACGSDEALELATTHADSIALVLADVAFRSAGGPDVYSRVAEKCPGASVLYVSAYPDHALVHQGVLTAGAPFLQKPFDIEELGAKVRAVLDARRLQA